MAMMATIQGSKDEGGLNMSSVSKASYGNMVLAVADVLNSHHRIKCIS